MDKRSVSFELDEDQVVAASRLAMGRRMPVRAGLIIPLALAVAAAGLWLSSQWQDRLLETLSYAVIAAGLALAIVYCFVAPWQARRHFRQLAAAQGETRFRWNEDGIVLSGEKGETRLGWGDFHCWMERERQLLLFQSLMFYNLVPKSALSDAQMGEIRSYLDAAGVRSY